MLRREATRTTVLVRLPEKLLGTLLCPTQFFSFNHLNGDCYLWSATVTKKEFHIDTSKLLNDSWTAGPRSCDGTR